LADFEIISIEAVSDQIYGGDGRLGKVLGEGIPGSVRLGRLG